LTEKSEICLQGKEKEKEGASERERKRKKKLPSKQLLIVSQILSMEAAAPRPC
jgi:hypothetical protein